MGMVNIGEKPVVRREAEASGEIILNPETIRKIRDGEIKKGDPFQVAEIAAINASKQTHTLIPHCHQIPLDTVNITFSINEQSIKVGCFVAARARTGVEMEALVGVSTALNTLWDMVKYLEKDDEGQYPFTRIREVRITKKIKEQ